MWGEGVEVSNLLLDVGVHHRAVSAQRVGVLRLQVLDLRVLRTHRMYNRFRKPEIVNAPIQGVSVGSTPPPQGSAPHTYGLSFQAAS